MFSQIEEIEGSVLSECLAELAGWNASMICLVAAEIVSQRDNYLPLYELRELLQLNLNLVQHVLRESGERSVAKEGK